VILDRIRYYERAQAQVAEYIDFTGTSCCDPGLSQFQWNPALRRQSTSAFTEIAKSPRPIIAIVRRGKRSAKLRRGTLQNANPKSWLGDLLVDSDSGTEMVLSGVEPSSGN
jgi:hypothetical protein